MADPTHFVLNALNSFGTSRYRIMRYAADGTPDPVEPIIGAWNNAGATHVSWPSAFGLSGGVTRVYAHRFISNMWRDIGIWESANGVDFTFEGLALEPDVSETQGVGPGVAFYATGEARPFKIITLSRRGSNLSTMILASSVTGLPGTWTRDGEVFHTDQTWEALFATPSYVFKTPGGQWCLAYMAFESATVGHAALAFADTLGDVFGSKVKILSPNSALVHSIDKARSGSSQAIATGTVSIGRSYLLRSGDQQAFELVRPIKQSGTVVHFERPFLFSYGAGSEMAHLGRYKIDPSYIYRKPDLTWGCYLTCFGFFTDWSKTTEFTAPASAPALTGPWTFDSAPPPFPPWTVDGFASTENPAPVIDVT